MSKLDDQLKELKAKKLKTEFFKLIKDNINKIESKDFADVAKDVKGEVTAFIDAQVNIIEGNEILDSGELSTLFSSDEVSILKNIVARALKKLPKEHGAKVLMSNPPQERPEKPELKKQDKIQFALMHRALGNKEVQVASQGKGICVGIDAPHIVVKFHTGVIVHVEPHEVLIV